ncbi:MAG TPA: S8 family serine peptidase [Thermoanaerobaculia bacterium]|jgi:hypothetical protein|nr:S8 family serine peptidase [Thermoanaerobaculia bacterium]
MFVRFPKLFASPLFVVCWVLFAFVSVLPNKARAGFHFCHRPDRPKPYDLPAGGCSDRQWIALADEPLPPEACPGVDGWGYEFLFYVDHENHQGRRFCRYLWNRETLAGLAPDELKLQNDIQMLRSRADLHGTVRRCGVVGTSAVTLAESNQEVLFRELRFQVGDMDMPFLAALADPSEPRKIRLSVLDTYPTTNEFPLGETCPSSHGHGIARIAQELICDGTAGGLHDCAAKVGTRLALPVTQLGVGALDQQPKLDTTVCGRFGSPVDLAVAINAEVDEWVNLPKYQTDKPDHLILNLSVGWDSELLHKGLGAIAADGLNAEELAVYAALWKAATLDVLVIAAAGNGQGGQQLGQGPLLPAGWYAKPPKTKLFPVFLPDQPDPVIWSIGAIDRNGKRLGNARPEAEPPLVAYGDHAVVQFDGKPWTDPLTGSSVGAAVASSLAALAWHLQPKLDRAGVMALLESSGTTLERNAESYREGVKPVPQVRRLSVASLLSRAWSPPKVHSYPPPATFTIECALGKWESSAAATGKIYKCPGAKAPDNEPATPLLQPLGEVPWVQTQPGANACPSCSIGSGGDSMLRISQTTTLSPIDLRLEIPDEWDQNTTVRDFWLEVVDAKEKRTTFWIGTPADVTGEVRLRPKNSVLVTNLPFPPDFRAAVLIARVDVGGKTLSLRMPIYVDPEK